MPSTPFPLIYGRTNQHRALGRGGGLIRCRFIDIEATSTAYTSLALAGRRLANTRKDYLGAVVEDTKVGDKLAILYGYNFLIILRSCGERYGVVGEAYVDGIMNGEATEACHQEEHEVRFTLL